MSEPRIESVAALSAEQVEAVLALAAVVGQASGAEPLSDAVLLDLRYGATTATSHLLLWEGSLVTGYAHLDLRGPTAELAEAELAAAEAAQVRRLLERLQVEVAAAGRPGLRIWAHGRRSAVGPVLSELGFDGERVLLQLRRSMSTPPPEPVWPDGVTVRTFEIGRDEAAWLAVNNAAFATHPDQSDWALEDITRREQEPWFDAGGFFLAERDGVLVGFHWTKVHSAPESGGEPIGEVYVVGVGPSMQGQHLGPALTTRGLIHLRDQGLSEVMLYVDESNTAAVHVYERLGFTTWDADVLFTSPA